MRACLLAVAALLLAASTGCHGINLAKGNCGGCPGPAACGGHGHRRGACADCGHGHFGHGGQGAYAGGHAGGYNGPPHFGTRGTPGFPHGGHHRDREYVGPPGPPTAQVAYPYYTIRGPRDFFIDNPPSIGR